EGIAFCVPGHELGALLEKVQHQTQADREKQTAFFNAQAAFRRMARAGTIYKIGIGDIKLTWLSAVKKFGNAVPQDFTGARSAFEGDLVRLNYRGALQMTDIDKQMSRLGTDPLLSEATRQKLAELWNTYEALQADYLNGTLNGNIQSYNTYNSKCQKY